MKVTIDIIDNTATLLARVGSPATVKGLNRAMAEEVKDYAKKWFVRLNSERPNKLGGKRTNFYNQIAKSVNTQQTSGGFTLGMAHVGLRQRWKGGRITAGSSGRVNPKTGKVPTLLTIPACAEAYGRRAGDFNNLRFALLGGVPALIEAEASKISFGKRGVKRKGSTLEVAAGKKRKVFYWLKKSVWQDPDPSVMPTDVEFAAVAAEAARSYVNRLQDGAR